MNNPDRAPFVPDPIEETEIIFVFTRADLSRLSGRPVTDEHVAKWQQEMAFYANPDVLADRVKAIRESNK